MEKEERKKKKKKKKTIRDKSLVTITAGILLPLHNLTQCPYITFLANQSYTANQINTKHNQVCRPIPKQPIPHIMQCPLISIFYYVVDIAAKYFGNPISLAS